MKSTVVLPLRALRGVRVPICLLRLEGRERRRRVLARVPVVMRVVMRSLKLYEQNAKR